MLKIRKVKKGNLIEFTRIFICLGSEAILQILNDSIESVPHDNPFVEYLINQLVRDKKDRTLFTAQSLVNFNPYHQSDGHGEKTDGTFDPVEGIFHHNQKYHSNKYQCGEFIPDSQSIGCPIKNTFLHRKNYLLTNKMVHQ